VAGGGGHLRLITNSGFAARGKTCRSSGRGNCDPDGIKARVEAARKNGRQVGRVARKNEEQPESGTSLHGL